MTRKNAYILISGIILISIVLGLQIRKTHFDYNFDKFFKPDDKETEYFNNHRELFGTDNDFILVGVESGSGIFSSDFLQKIDSLSRNLAEVPYVKRVISPTNLDLKIRDRHTGLFFSKPLLSGDSKKDSISVLNDPSYTRSFFSESLDAMSIVILTEQMLSKEKSDIVNSELRRVMDESDVENYHLAGRAIGQVVYINKIQNEFTLFLAISVSIVILILFFMFRSFRGIIIPLITVLLSVVWSLGILNLFDLGIGILLNMLPPVIFVVGMSDAVHLYSRYLEELKKGRSKEVAIHETIYDTGLATFLTSLTTAVGFGSLYFTGIPSLQEFGLITACGVIAAFIIAITLLPAWLVLTETPARSLKIQSKSIWSGILTSNFSRIIRNRTRILVSCSFLILIFIVFGSRIGLNNFLLEDLEEDEPLRKDFEFFDQNFSGVRPFELGIKSKDSSSLLNLATIQDINEIQEFLRDDYGVGAIQSTAEMVKTLNRSINRGMDSSYQIPDNENEWARIQKSLQASSQSQIMSLYAQNNHSYLRISGRTKDLGGQIFSEKDKQLKNFLEQKGFSEKYDIETTGTGKLIDRTNQNLVSSLSKGLGVALLLIAFIVVVMFRSIKMLLIALVPNIIPLLALVAIMAVFHIDLKMSTSIIFTIAFGIAVDDTIHLLSRYRLELRKGRSHIFALKNSFTHTGKALIITTLILLGGFVGMSFSSFKSTHYIGVLVSCTLLLALVFDLTLLPALLSMKKDRLRS